MACPARIPGAGRGPREMCIRDSTGGVTTLKTDVAWVGNGYSMALDGVKTAYDIITEDVNFRPNIISLDGWAGTQRFAGIWTGDQTGGNWEYIRFHIPTYIGPVSYTHLAIWRWVLVSPSATRAVTP